LTSAYGWNESTWRRLGCILRQNTSVEELILSGSNLDVSGLCVGLQHNRCIRKLVFGRIDLQDSEQMNNLVPFLTSNPSLKEVSLYTCKIGPADINILSNALMNRSEDTLEKLDLSNNHFGDIDLDKLFLVLNRNKKMTRLDLSRTGFGLRGCTLLAKLLENQESSLERLSLSGNSINDESAIILAESLTKNTKLKRLYLDGNDGVTKGWLAILQLVCNCSSINDVMKSNHTLHSVGMQFANDMKKVEHVLGVDDANLLYASLDLNESEDNMWVVRRKILWSHARGNFNLGDSSIATGAMTRILAWIGNDSNETNANLIQYNNPPLPEAEIDAVRLDSVYRILRSSTILLNGNDNAPNNDLEARQNRK